MAANERRRLSLANLGRLPRSLRPAIDPRALSVGIVHLGVGAFHRAHQAVYTEAASLATGELCWGICGVSERSPVAVETLSAQDGLYSVLAVSPSLSSAQIIVSLRRALYAQDEPDALIALLSSPAVKVVTLTVTEKGYRFNPSDRRLRDDDQELDADGARRPPVTVLGQLARGFEARRRLDAGPLTVISCDNIPANGHVLLGLVNQFVSRQSARFDQGLDAWIDENVCFPSTMVDRIVPATTAQWRQEVARRIALIDEAPVVTEHFSQWVIEDRFATVRPAWERAGAEIVLDVAPYEALKLRVLNGSHSALAYLGLLAGSETIAEALSRQHFEAFVRAMITEEVEPTLALPVGTDFAAYVGTALARFANASLPYRCLQVAMDGSQKLPQRVLGTVRDRLRAGQSFRCGALVVAAWLRAVWTGRDDRGRPFDLHDPLAEALRHAISGTSEPARVVERALRFDAIFGTDLAHEDRFRAALEGSLLELTESGADAAVAATAP